MLDLTQQLQRNDLLELHSSAGDDAVLAAIAHLDAIYPGFDHWVHCKVLPGVRNGTRRIRALVSDNGRVRAVAIAKRTGEEQKLCTLWVAPSSRTCGLAGVLAADAFEWLGTSKPLFTVPDTMIPEFKSLLSRWDFKQTQLIDDAYLLDHREHVFNGQIHRFS